MWHRDIQNTMSFPHIAIVGATGAVGQTLLRVLEERDFQIGALTLFASERSKGRTLRFRGKDTPVTVLDEHADLSGIDLAFFSAGGARSHEWAPRFAEAGAYVVDNSSAFRKDPLVPLVVPPVNADALERLRETGGHIVANPNCSTAQLVLALAPIHAEVGIERVVVSTYQAVSGAGATAVSALEDQMRALVNGEPMPESSLKTLKGQLAGNLLMHWTYDAKGYQEEETKMLHETRKILGDEAIRVSPTAVRVPVLHGHSESVTIETKAPLDTAAARAILASAPGVVLQDDPGGVSYPTPLEAEGNDATYVGRIRDDIGNTRDGVAYGVQFWVVSDNLRRGAATNAVEIGEALMERGFIA